MSFFAIQFAKTVQHILKLLLKTVRFGMAHKKKRNNKKTVSITPPTINEVL